MSVRSERRGGEPVLRVRDLRVAFPGVTAVDGISFTLSAGRCLGIVGESGSGKTVTALALLGLHRGTAARVSGEIRVGATDLTAVTDGELRALRGSRIAMVFQDPLASLDPFHRVGDQIAEVYRAHNSASRAAGWARAVEVLDQVGIPDPAQRARAYPHQFSGGMRQRVMIAMALACRPRVLIADEPTTALDVTVQAQILDLLDEVRTTTGMGLVLVSHDLGVVAGMADDVLVMHRGKAVEHGRVDEVLLRPAAPYTQGLLAAVPRLDVPRSAPPRPPEPAPLLAVHGVHHRYPGRRGDPPALTGVTLNVRAGEALGIVGESGSGKTTLARLMVRLLTPTSGTVTFDGTDITHLPERRLRPVRQALQMVFQDPASSLNPRRTVGDSIAEPLLLGALPPRGGTRPPGGGTRREVERLLDRVGLPAAHYDRYPHELSVGMRQRVGIARALAPRPRVLVCDEPVSALDVSTQAQILDLLAEVRREYGLTLVFVSHDLAVIRQISDRVMVMRAGTVVESGDVDEVYDRPQHPYTKALLDAIPVTDPVEARHRRQRRRQRAAPSPAADHTPSASGSNR